MRWWRARRRHIDLGDLSPTSRLPEGYKNRETDQKRGPQEKKCHSPVQPGTAQIIGPLKPDLGGGLHFTCKSNLNDGSRRYQPMVAFTDGQSQKLLANRLCGKCMFAVTIRVHASRTPLIKIGEESRWCALVTCFSHLLMVSQKGHQEEAVGSWPLGWKVL